MRVLVAILGIALALAVSGSSVARAASSHGSPILTAEGLRGDSPTLPAVVWDTGTAVPGGVFIVDGAGERLYANAPRGRQEAPWLRSAGRTGFRLYSYNGHRKLIATLEVEGGRAATRIVARAHQPPRTSEAVNAIVLLSPVIGIAALLALVGWYVRERRT